jgi:ABC-2 type transport system permease protein
MTHTPPTLTSLIKAETVKLLTTRLAYGVLAGMVFVAGPGILLAGPATVEELSVPLHEQIWYFIAAGITRLLVVVLGIRAITDEFRYGTIVPTMLAAPDRHRVMTAKALVIGAAGLVFTVLAEAVMVAVAAGLIQARGAELIITGETLRALVGMAAAGLLWGVIGVAIGAIVRHQLPAIVGSVLWLLPGGGVEELIRSQIGRLGDYLPGNEGMALALFGTNAGLVAATVLTVYALVLTVGGILIIRSRDIAS